MTYKQITYLVGGSIILIIAIFLQIQNTPDPSNPRNFKVAFIGDQGLNSDSKAVLRLIKDEGVDMVLHQGDLDYKDNPDTWDKMINDILGQDFPYFVSIGNHDVKSWSGYQEKVQARIARVDGVTCIGDIGVKSACTYKGLFFILSGAGTMGSEHDTFIRDMLKNDTSTWRICSWHRNQNLMMTGKKIRVDGKVGWGPYRACREGGAIIVTGHQHSYSRSHLMSNFESASIASTSNTLQIERGKSFVVINGLGGQSIRGSNDKLAANEWWASVYSSKQGAKIGALFCAFNLKESENTAYCYFKNIDGEIPDEFYIVKQ